MNAAPTERTSHNAADSIVACVMENARSAQTQWAATPIAERLEYLKKFRSLAASRPEQLALLAAEARHRPVAETLASEVIPLLDACRFLEAEASRLLAPRDLGVRGRPLWLSNVRSEITREPLGVILIIAPSNYPLLLPGVQLLQSLAAGNAVLLKPGVNGTAVARALIDLLLRAGINPNLIWLLPESTAAAEAAIAAHPDKVLFTGSATNGEKVLSRLSTQLIPATMELSGCDAVIVREDADLDLAAKAILFGVCLNNGATCIAPRRVFVMQSIARQLESRLSAALRYIEAARHHLNGVGNISPENALVLRPLLRHAISSGAHYLSGGVRLDNSIAVPVTLAGVPHDSPLLNNDCFAPVLAVVPVKDDEEAIALTNRNRFGLAASVFGRDVAGARRIAARLHTGTVTINDLIVPTADPRIPFGGRKRSGFGVTRGAEGLLELTTPKVTTVTRGKFRPAFEPARPNQSGLLSAYIQWRHSATRPARWKALYTLIHQLINSRGAARNAS